MARLGADASSKTPQITLIFWIIKILATTLGETGGDAVSMSMDLGYAVSSGIFITLFLGAVAAQVAAHRLHPALYWTVIVATTTAGTTMADFADRSLGIGYVGGSLVLLALVLLSLGLWRAVVGSVSVAQITSRRVEIFYWVTILFSNTLGTALGDYVADESGLGFQGAALVFAGALALVACAYAFTKVSRDLLFWLAFILTRPLGATVGDLLTKAHEEGGLDLSRFGSAAIIALAMIGCIVYAARTAARPQPAQ